jgi:hypothetical protein
MKRLILPLVAFLCLSLNTFAQSNACNIYQFTLQYLSHTATATPGKYDLRVNLSWDVSANSGNKYSFFHIWQNNSYAAIDYSRRPPAAADLSATLGTIVVENPSTNFKIGTVYLPDVSYTKVLATGTGNGTLTRQSLGNGIERFTVTNLLIPGVDYNAAETYDFRADIWSSQHASANNVHCLLKDKIFVVNNVVSRSLLQCSGGAIVDIRLQSSQPSSAGTYQLYVDSDNPGSFDGVNDLKIGSELPYTTSSTPLLSGDFPYTFSGGQANIPSQYNGKLIWMVVSLNGSSTQVFTIANTCAVLPVTFSGFSAIRSKQQVNVKWQTAMEENTAGFNVQRLTNGNWSTIAFVPAKNSASGGAYEMTDVNTYRGLSQYRIVSVDLDGRQKMSDVRSVRGEEASSKLTVYPNPSTTGRINLVFDNNAVRDIAVIDMTGRIVKQLRGESNANVTLDIQHDGLYQVQITDRITNEIVMEKILIKKR